jgi:methyl-accepting chemotaxis protein
MLCSIGLVTLVAFAALSLTVGFKAGNMAREQAAVSTKHMVSHYSDQVQSQVEAALQTARSLAQAMEGMRSRERSPDRGAVAGMLRNIARRNDRFYGVWMCWEPNAFDGRDAQVGEARWNDGQGHFVPYAYHQDGEIEIVPLSDYQTADYYLKARRSGEATVLEPFQYEVEGETVLMTTLAVPIEVEGQVLGVAGVDLSLGAISRMLADLDLSHGGFMSVISQGHSYVGHPEKSLAGSKVTAEHEWLRDHLRELGDGGGFVVTNHSTRLGAEALRVARPFEIGQTGTSWTAMATIPMHSIMAKAERITWLTLLIGGVGFLVVAAVVYLLARSIANPVQRIVDGLRASAEQVTSASSQLSSSSQQMAEGTSEQASNLEETSSSLEEMSSQTKQNADNAGQVETSMNQAGEVVESGVEAMDRMSQTIEEIRNSSAETSKIVKTIDDIAFQTNLLALNAAVEAARAGDAGKGFAVVAEEVRNLAQRSAEAAKSTSELIEKSQKKSEDGVSVAQEVSSNLHLIKENRDKVGTLISEISAASKEQAQGIDQVNNAVAEMDKVVQRNASDSEETASAAQELSSQARELDAMVQRLVGIVSGSNGRGDWSTNGSGQGGSSSRPVGASSGNGGDRSVPAGSGQQQIGRSSGQGPATHQRPQQSNREGKTSRPEQTIPLDEDSFKDF